MTQTRLKPVSKTGENAGEQLIAWNTIAQVRNITFTYVTWAIKALPQFYFVLNRVTDGDDLKFSESKFSSWLAL